MKTLEIGCGFKKMKDSIGLDIVKTPKVKVVHDLNKVPYPFSDEEFDVIWADNVLEHLDIPLDEILQELCRILKHDGLIKIIVPNCQSVGAFADPTHKKFFSWFTFDYFGSNEQSFYSKARVKILKRELRINIGKKASKILKPLKKFVNKFPMIYINFLSFLPVNEIYFELGREK